MKKQCFTAILAWALALKSTSFAETTYPLNLCELKTEAPKYDFSCKEALRISSKEELLQVLAQWLKTLESTRAGDSLIESFQRNMELPDRSHPRTPQLVHTLINAAGDLLLEHPPLVDFLDGYILPIMATHLAYSYFPHERRAQDRELLKFSAYIQKRPRLKEFYDSYLKNKITHELLSVGDRFLAYARENLPLASHFCHQLKQQLLRPGNSHPYAHLNLVELDYLLNWEEEITALCPQLITPGQFQALSSYRLDFLRQETRWPRCFIRKAKEMLVGMIPFATVMILFTPFLLGVHFLDARDRARNHLLNRGLNPLNAHAAA